MYSEAEKQLRRKLSSMKHRCYGKNLDSSTAKHYRDKGIRICSEWLNDPNAFVKWSLENGYEVGLTIDRIDPDGNYEPSNCQWITLSENSKKAAEDTRRRSLERTEQKAKLNKEMAEFMEGVRRAGSLNKYFWLEMYDELTKADRSSIEFAVSILKLMRENDKSARMFDAFACSERLVSLYKEKTKDMEDTGDKVRLAFNLASDFLKPFITGGTQE